MLGLKLSCMFYHHTKLWEKGIVSSQLLFTLEVYLVFIIVLSYDDFFCAIVNRDL